MPYGQPKIIKTTPGTRNAVGSVNEREIAFFDVYLKASQYNILSSGSLLAAEGFDQQTAHFLVIHNKVIRPFYPKLDIAQCLQTFNQQQTQNRSHTLPTIPTIVITQGSQIIWSGLVSLPTNIEVPLLSIRASTSFPEQADGLDQGIDALLALILCVVH